MPLGPGRFDLRYVPIALGTLWGGPLAGLVVNRASVDPGPELSQAAATAAAEKLRAQHDDTAKLAAGLLRLHADRKLLVAREARLRDRFARSHPHVPTAVLPDMASEVPFAFLGPP